MTLDMPYVQERYDDVWRTRTLVQTSSSSTQLLRISNLMVMTWEVRERACESAHANKHLVRCEARRYEYRLKYGRNPPVTTHRVNHEPETVPEGTAHGERETNPVPDREREPASSSQPPSEPAQTETTHTRVKRLRFTRKTTSSE